MTQATDAEATLTQKPPRSESGALGWLRNNLFNGWFNTLLTIVTIYVLARLLPPLVEWAFVNSTWGHVPPEVCRQSPDGACWAFVAEKYRLILFGTYPYAEQWRPLLSIIMLVGLLVASCNRRFWSLWLGVAWAVGAIVFCILMWGGVFGLVPVSNSNWGGLTLTLLLSVVGIAVAFPIAILLALGRRSHMPAVKAVCVTYIELIRGVPLVSLLFMASIMMPLFLPTGVTVDKLLRAQIAIIAFIAAYLAEVIRGGLQGLPKGQYEGADSLGLSYWQSMRLIVLPQALRLVIPPIVNTFIGAFKDTSLVLIVGLLDLMLSTRQAISDAPWRPFFVEGYIFAGLIYWVFCYSMSKYSQYLERDLGKAHRR